MSQNSITVTSENSWLSKVEAAPGAEGTYVTMPAELYQKLQWEAGTILRWTVTKTGFIVEVVEGAKLA